MERIKQFELKIAEVGQYKGVKIYTSNNTPREWVAAMSPAGYIEIHPNAYKILQERPDFLKRIWEHELKYGPLHEPHICDDSDIILYLKERGYDFGNLKV